MDAFNYFVLPMTKLGERSRTDVHIDLLVRH